MTQSYLLFGDEDYLGMFAASYTAAMRRMRLVGEFARSACVIRPGACLDDCNMSSIFSFRRL